MKKYLLYDQFDACIVAESDNIDELEKKKAKIIEDCPIYNKPNRLAILKN